ncbi:hypothetical protein ASE86_08380 [Sphingomonas sp. Leaf33]|uniref:hypothetical protein n=1 Tax=Sphingomonas sp. Leaf33 TaxID=1736215 RepID=UPI0006F8951D|nr:hypothetical protein [Sphingomonas sp. Leaf33]KQN26159.1 hypothetical protein ASE86_08380 [Sphingomonas sp. Leaf33]
MILRPILAAAALLSAATAQAQAPACIPQPEAEALFLALAPAMLTSVAGTCTPVLPTNALLRRPIGQLIAKYASDSEAAWPRAKEGLRKLLGPQGGAMVDSELARPMVTSMIAPMLAKEVKAKDCPNIDRVLTLIDPLPARNTASLVVALMDMSGAAKARPGRRADFVLCPREVRP